MLLTSSPSETATQILQKVTRHRPQRIATGPPVVKPLARSCANVDHVPNTEKANASILKRLNFRVRGCSTIATSYETDDV